MVAGSVKRGLRLTAPLRASALALLVLAPAAGASAFCRTTTTDSQVDTCLEPCELEGYPLAWDEGTIRYVFNERGFPNFTDAQQRAVFAESFNQWLSVRCRGERVELDIAALNETTSLVVRPKETAYRTNVIGHLSQTEWLRANFDRRAFAQTSVRYDSKSGIILGADIWFNGGIGNFTVCSETGCSASSDDVDLPNVATHEIGHFLGLAHTNVDGATMTCDALPTDVDKRSLENDDKAGLCEIYPPGIAFQSQYVQGEWSTSIDEGDSACSTRPGRSANGALMLAVLAGLALIVKRRRVRT